MKKTKKPTKKFKKRVSVKVKVAKTKPIKNTLAYFNCMSACCLKKQKISKTAHECKTNALAINQKISAQKLQEIKKLGASFNKFKSNLERFVQKSIK
jgi:hypothetical protein